MWGATRERARFSVGVAAFGSPAAPGSAERPRLPALEIAVCSERATALDPPPDGAFEVLIPRLYEDATLLV